MARSVVRLQIAENRLRKPRVGLDQVHDRPVRGAILIEFHKWDSQTLLVDLRGVAGTAPGHPSADIGHVPAGTSPSDQLPLEENRLQHVDIR